MGIYNLWPFDFWSTNATIVPLTDIAWPMMSSESPARSWAASVSSINSNFKPLSAEAQQDAWWGGRSGGSALISGKIKQYWIMTLRRGYETDKEKWNTERLLRLGSDWLRKELRAGVGVSEQRQQQQHHHHIGQTTNRSEPIFKSSGCSSGSSLPVVVFWMALP